VARWREAAHVGPALGQHALFGPLVDAGDRPQQPELLSERGDHLVDLGRQLLDRIVHEVDPGEDGAHDQGVVQTEAPDEGLLELRMTSFVRRQPSHALRQESTRTRRKAQNASGELTTARTESGRTQPGSYS